MTLLYRLFDRLTYAMHLISGVILISMMFTTLADVLSRSLFKLTNGGIDLTFIGGIELIKYGLLFMVLFALPYSAGRSQVIVDLFTEKLPERGKKYLEGSYMLGFTALSGGMSYRFIHAASESFVMGETTQDLWIPLYYLYYTCAAATAVLCFSTILIALQCFLSTHKENAV